MRRSLPLLALLLCAATAAAQQAPRTFTHADTLRGSWDTPARGWWDVTFYDLRLRVNPADSTISGSNGISYRVVSPGRELQIDLMEPLVLDSVTYQGKAIPLRKEGPAHFATLPARQTSGVHTVVAHYSGRPLIARRPPWDGGISWDTDSLGRTWIATTDQGMGASAWWPNKDTQADEPDSQRVAITVPKPLIQVGNGRLRSVRHNPDSTTTWEWFNTRPINNYAIALAVGNYAHYSEIYQGELGPMTLDYWPLDYNLDAAKRQWTQVRTMMQCFEHWFGPYPWYEDGYKLIQVPNTGMEHQTAVTYGNWFRNGYRGRDDSGTGLGLLFDFIIVHESAHEWFANNITSKDNADMWVHESFANYAEGLHVECIAGKSYGARYIIGTRRGIANRLPIIPEYGVNAQGPGDMYPKGGNMLHTIRQIVDNDDRWREVLRGLNSEFRHQTVMGSDIEAYIARTGQVKLDKVFDQYLRRANIPVFEYRVADGVMSYRWTDVVPGFDMPLRVRTDAATRQQQGGFPGGTAMAGWTRLSPTAEWQTVPVTLPADQVAVDENYYVEARRVQ